METPVLHKEPKDTPGYPDYSFFCPGCKCEHGVWTTTRNSNNALWGFNQNVYKPTFTPSIKVSWTDYEFDEEDNVKPESRRNMVCHSFVRDGMIEFLGDCTHGLAGQTVPLQPF